jgi:hypothetical protein
MSSSHCVISTTQTSLYDFIDEVLSTQHLAFLVPMTMPSYINRKGEDCLGCDLIGLIVRMAIRSHNPTHSLYTWHKLCCTFMHDSLGSASNNLFLIEILFLNLNTHIFHCSMLLPARTELFNWQGGTVMGPSNKCRLVKFCDARWNDVAPVQPLQLS